MSANNNTTYAWRFVTSIHHDTWTKKHTHWHTGTLGIAEGSASNIETTKRQHMVHTSPLLAAVWQTEIWTCVITESSRYEVSVWLGGSDGKMLSRDASCNRGGIRYLEPLQRLFRPYPELIPSLFRALPEWIMTKLIKTKTLFRAYSVFIPSLFPICFKLRLWENIGQQFVDCVTWKQGGKMGKPY